MACPNAETIQSSPRLIGPNRNGKLAKNKTMSTPQAADAEQRLISSRDIANESFHGCVSPVTAPEISSGNGGTSASPRGNFCANSW